VKISVIGCGYLGAVHAAAMASLGHEVVGIDRDAERVRVLARGEAPFFEPGLAELLVAQLATRRLTFDTELESARGASVHFITVGTPENPDGSVDVSAVRAAVSGLAAVVAPGDVVVGKSTVPVGLGGELAEVVEGAGGRLVCNPEFLREGFALHDTLEPDRLVYGVRAGDDEAVAALDAVYAPLVARGTPRIVTDFATAELTKVAANAFIATKISFINAMAEIAEVVGADVTQLADVIGHDPRIGRRLLNAGAGFGGGCLPKDIRGFIGRAEELGVGQSLAFLREVDAINLRRRARVVELAREAVGGDLDGARVTVLGLAFKPDSDDVRDSPALDVAHRLREAGAHVTATDPHAIATARRIDGELDYVDDELEALRGADVVLLLTEWRQFTELDPVAARRLVARPHIVDARNALDPGAWRAAGWTYRGLGRP
jgi:UDPglucose 6-dehydrogenase